MKNNFDDLYYPENIKEILYKNVDEKMVDHIRRENIDHLDETAQTLFGVKFTYKELFDNIVKYAKALKSYGLEKGDCITLAMPNIPETIYYFYACNEIGVTAYLIDPRSTFNNMLTCINNSNSKLFICEMTTYYDKVAQNIDLLPVNNVVVVSPLNSLDKRKDLSPKLQIVKKILDVKEYIAQIKNDSKDTTRKYYQEDLLKWGEHFIGNYSSKYNPDIPAIIVNTSGTTGNNIKGAIHSNKTYNIYANEAQFVTDQLDRGNTYYGYIPYFSMYGSGVGMHVALSYGVVINNIPKLNGQKSIDEIVNSKANILIGTPNLMEKVVGKYVKEDIDASHVKQYIIGGDNISPEKLKSYDEKMLKRGMKRKMVFGYGATECMPISTFTPDERSHLYGSTGIVYPMAYIKIIDPETGKELGYNEEGEVYIYNQTMMVGYLNNKRENEEVLKKIDGKIYYKSGDKGYLTETGHLFLTGRYKRMMKRPDGHQVSPIPIENTINESEYVADCAVIGLTRNEGQLGVIPTAFLKLKNVGKEEVGNIVKAIAEDSLQKLSGEREAALAYVIVDNIPYTKNDKVDFKKLEELKFDNLSYFVIADPVTQEYFNGMNNYKLIKLDKQYIRTLNK